MTIVKTHERDEVFVLRELQIRAR